MIDFQDATKEKTKLRLAIYGPTGSGKTFTALRIAKGILEHITNGVVNDSKKIAGIDSENRTMRKYSDRFKFKVLDLEKKDIKSYCDGIKLAEKYGYDVLIIDSLSHAWKELKKEVDRIAKARFGGNTWAAWSQGNPIQDYFIETILNFPGHIITTMRSHTDWIIEKNDKGKSMPIRVGLNPDQGKDIEYEFDMLIEMNADHWGNIIKDRSGKFQDEFLHKPGEELGKALAEWLDDGEEFVKPKKQVQMPVNNQNNMNMQQSPMENPLLHNNIKNPIKKVAFNPNTAKDEILTRGALNGVWKFFDDDFIQHFKKLRKSNFRYTQEMYIEDKKKIEYFEKEKMNKQKLRAMNSDIVNTGSATDVNINTAQNNTNWPINKKQIPPEPVAPLNENIKEGVIEPEKKDVKTEPLTKTKRRGRPPKAKPVENKTQEPGLINDDDKEPDFSFNADIQENNDLPRGVV